MKRLKELIASLGLSQSEFLKQVRFSPGYLSQKSFKQSLILPSSADKLQESIPNLNIGWLLEGIGEMTTDGQPARINRFKGVTISDSFNRNSLSNINVNSSCPDEVLVTMKERIVQLESEVERLHEMNARLQEANNQLGDILASVLCNGNNIAH